MRYKNTAPGGRGFGLDGAAYEIAAGQVADLDDDVVKRARAACPVTDGLFTDGTFVPEVASPKVAETAAEPVVATPVTAVASTSPEVAAEVPVVTEAPKGKPKKHP